MIKKYSKLLLDFVISLCLIQGALGIGNLIQTLLHCSVPGSVIGMIVLFLTMATGIIKVQWVRPGATLFIRYMILLFVPISVGLMDHFDMLIANAMPIIASTIGGSLIVLVTLSLLLDYLLKEKH